MISRVFLLLLICLWSDVCVAQVNCGEQPKDVPTETQQELKGDVEGKAQLFTKLLGNAELSRSNMIRLILSKAYSLRGNF